MGKAEESNGSEGPKFSWSVDSLVKQLGLDQKVLGITEHPAILVSVVQTFACF